MTDEPMIGDWIVREHRGLPHLVESLVAGDVVTRCGRRLANEPTRTGGRLVDGLLGVGCRQCVGRAT